MPKRFRQKLDRVKPLDLHGIHHRDVARIVEDYVLLNQDDLPLKIITGNSDKMKTIVIEALIAHKFNYTDGDLYNRGYIDVIN